MKEKKSRASRDGFLAGSASLRNNRASCSFHVGEVDESSFRAASILGALAPLADVEGAGLFSLTGVMRGTAAFVVSSALYLAHLALAASRNFRRISADTFLAMNLFERIVNVEPAILGSGSGAGL